MEPTFAEIPTAQETLQRPVTQNTIINITRKFPSTVDPSKYSGHQELRTYFYYIIIFHNRYSGVFPTSPESTHWPMQPESWRIISSVFLMSTMCSAIPGYSWNDINCLIIGNPNSLDKASKLRRIGCVNFFTSLWTECVFDVSTILGFCGFNPVLLKIAWCPCR